MLRDQLKQAILRFLLGLLAQFDQESLLEETMTSAFLSLGLVADRSDLSETIAELRSSALLAMDTGGISLTGLGLVTAAGVILPSTLESTLSLAAEIVRAKA